ncbi:MAG: hypothetical protein U0V70_20660 [Terriglobia bacterium]
MRPTDILDSQLPSSSQSRRRQAGHLETPVAIKELQGILRAEGRDYLWEWKRDTDEFSLRDKHGLEIVNGKMQPAVVVSMVGQTGPHRCSSGKYVSHSINLQSITISYERVNGNSAVTMTWRFQQDGFWLDPIHYDSTAAEDVVRVHYFSIGKGEDATPTLTSDYFVLPGIMQCSTMNPVFPVDRMMNMRLTENFWLGRGYLESPRFLQQWGLPVHYFCGFHRSPYDFQRTPGVPLTPTGAEGELLDAFCCGLADLPNGDLFFDTRKNQYGIFVNYRGDLWGHLRGPAAMKLGAALFWTVGPNYYEAIRRYYRGLLGTGAIRKKVNSPHKNKVALAASFDTWGAQCARQEHPDRFNENTLNDIYDGMLASGIKVDNFVIDGFWEEKYGDLRHDPKRFPHFDATLNRIRGDGRYLGLWSAFMRLEDPAELGLTKSHMLRKADGTAFEIRQSSPIESHPFHIMDFTQPEVQEVIRKLAKDFIKRYNPDFIKFDFGYELPVLDEAAPHDMNWAGERILLKGLQIVVEAMREENPDIVVMYYSLSPLLIDYIDVHSPDDLMISLGEYDLESNRRFFFSSLLGEIGMPTWGSGGYDWLTSPEIWFDSAPLGTLGSLGSFSSPDPHGLATPERVAKFNGLKETLRLSETFSIVPLDADYYGPVRGAHTSSWLRFENGELVMAALREYRLTGGKGSKRYQDQMETTTSVVVSSKTSDGISKTSRLAVVPFGEGELRLRREDQSSGLIMTEHYFPRGARSAELKTQNGELRIPLREKSEDGTLIEWIDIEVQRQ